MRESPHPPEMLPMRELAHLPEMLPTREMALIYGEGQLGKLDGKVTNGLVRTFGKI
jgi:hypothetical protein